MEVKNGPGSLVHALKISVKCSLSCGASQYMKGWFISLFVQHGQAHLPVGSEGRSPR